MYRSAIFKFNKVASLHPVALLRKHCGVGFFRNAFFIEHLWARLLHIISPLRNYLVSQNFKKETLPEHAFHSKLIFFCQTSILIFFLKCNNFLESLSFLGQILVTNLFYLGASFLLASDQQLVTRNYRIVTSKQ